MMPHPSEPPPSPRASASGEIQVSKSRPSAIRPANLKHGPNAPRRDTRLPSIGDGARVAARNSDEAEFDQIRKACEQLVQRSMTAAEAGVRLQQLLQRHPDLLAYQSGGSSSQLEGDGKHQSRRELLPLPSPEMTPIREEDLVSMFEGVAVLSPKAKKAGAQAWLCLLVAALNGLDSHGKTKAYFGPPSVPQAKALADLLEDCQRFVADDSARTPTDFTKELGAKLHSYWGEPVYCATELTLKQVLPTLPAKGIAASVEIMDILEGQIRDQIGDPESLLLPEEEWPEKPPRARTMLKDPREWGGRSPASFGSAT